MPTYLITGGAGFIGRHLARELTGAGHAVRILDSLVEQAHGGSGREALPPAAEFLHADLRDGAALRRALPGVDGIFHLAAEVGVGQSMYEIERYVSANDLATAVLMQEVVKHPVKRIVVASSMSVYGEGLYRDGAGGLAEGARRTPAALRAGRWDLRDASGAPLAPVATDETKRPDLTSVYALTKFNQEQLTLMLAAAYGIEAVALRLFNVFGPGQSLSNPYTGVLAIFAGRLLNGERPLVFEDGRQRRDFVHVADVARAFRLAMQAPEAAGEIINIGSGRSYAVADVAAMLAGAMGREALTPDILARSRAGDVRHCFADIAKARRLLRFEPRRPLEQAVSELVAHVSRQRSRDHVAEAHRELAERGLVI